MCLPLLAESILPHIKMGQAIQMFLLLLQGLVGGPLLGHGHQQIQEACPSLAPALLSSALYPFTQHVKPECVLAKSLMFCQFYLFNVWAYGLELKEVAGEHEVRKCKIHPIQFQNLPADSRRVTEKEDNAKEPETAPPLISTQAYCERIQSS